MTAPKLPDARPDPAEQRTRPDPLPTDGDTVREVGKRAYRDARGPTKDTDQDGRQAQRDHAPAEAPTRRSDKTGGTDDR